MQQQPAVGAIVHVSYISLFLFAHVVICSFVSFPPHLLIFVSRVLTVEFARF